MIIRVLLLILIFCVNVYAITPVILERIGKQAAAGGVSALCNSCGTCGGCATADFVCEDWDTDNSCTWTEALGGNPDDIDQAAAHSGALACTDKGTQTLQLTMDNGGDTFIYTDIGDQAIVYYSMYINVVSETLDNTEIEEILNFSKVTSADTNASQLRLYQDGSGNLLFRFNWRVSGSAWSADYDSSAISTGTWYRLRFLLDYTNKDVYFYVDAEEVVNSTTADLDRTHRYFAIGTEAGSTSWSYVIQVENIQIDNDTIPGACPE